VVKLTVMQVYYSLAHAAMTTVANIDTSLQAYPGTATDSTMLTIDRFDAPRVDSFKAWL
jgi:hypothetical protein